MSNAPKLTQDYIESKIRSAEYMVSETFTICLLGLENGFKVVGKSACASAENFDKTLGEKYALENAIENIWELEGYLLKQKLYEQNK